MIEDPKKFDEELSKIASIVDERRAGFRRAKPTNRSEAEEKYLQSCTKLIEAVSEIRQSLKRGPLSNLVDQLTK